VVRDLVLDDPAPFVPLTTSKRRKSVNYEAKAVTLAGRRYIVCRNHDEALWIARKAVITCPQAGT